ncbi:MAG: LytTR family DNA-binding domain-containing protein [Massilia sp.]
MTMVAPRILIADDEPLLRAELREALARLWPQAELVGEAADGVEALRMAQACSPDIAFLDIRMPGLSGIELARVFGGRTHVVFVTAYEEHAVAAFEEGATDYLLKPIDMARLARCVERLRAKLALPPPDLSRLAAPAARKPAPSWLQASVGQTIHFIDLKDVLYFAADTKYTRVVTADLEAHIRTSLKELAESLDDSAFWQIHRGYMVAVGRIASANRDDDGRLWVNLRGQPARLPVSERFQHRFKGM